MSTVPEVIAAAHMGARVLGLSCCTNLAAGVTGEKLSHAEVTETAARVRDSSSRSSTRILERLASGAHERTLIEAARAVRANAHAPYSRYHVGAAVRGDSGKIYVGANVENASYGLALCAERNAIAAAVAAGEKRVTAVAVVTATSPPAAPCGMCRQVLAEFAGDEPAGGAGQRRRRAQRHHARRALAARLPQRRPDMSRLVVAGGTIVDDGRRSPGRGRRRRRRGRAHRVELCRSASDSSLMRAHERIDAGGCIVMPGLVQAHTHLCQTLVPRRRRRPASCSSGCASASGPTRPRSTSAPCAPARGSPCAELLLGGTTAILDMGTVHETDALFDAVAATGMRATIGKAMMDAGDGVPARLRETTRRSLDESDALSARWHGAADGRLRYAYAPRFVLSCTEELLREVGARVHRGARLHTHACEQRGRDRAGAARARRRQHRLPRVARARPARAPPSRTASTPPTTSARRLAASGTHVAHCPSSNLKLGSGIAPIPEMLAQGIHVALGADGAPCNNNLDGFLELRLAALLHKPRAGADGDAGGDGAASWRRAAARPRSASSDEIGSLELGKRADLIVVDPRTPHAAPSFDAVSTLVYAAQSRDVRDVARRRPRCSCATARSPRRPASTAPRWSPSPQAEAARVQARVRA